MSIGPLAADPSGETARRVSVDGSHGFQVGNHNQQVNVGMDAATLPPARVVGDGPVVHNLPPASAVFEGRDLAELAELLNEPGTGVALGQAAVHGLGGVGKSELANQYARAYLDRYRLVWWVTADSPDNLALGLATLTELLHPAATLVADRQAWAFGWLQSHEGWLLVLDNVEDLADIAGLLGQVGGRGQLLVTTRRNPGRAIWRRAGLQPVRLGVLDRSAGVRLLLDLTGSDDAEGAGRLVDELGGLPLALEQAASYLSQNPIGFEAYLGLLAQRFTRMAELGSEGGTARRSIAQIWQQSMTVIVSRSPLAGRVMAVLARLAPDGLPEMALAPLAEDDLDIGQALALLASYSMINRADGLVSMHRLVQAVTRAGNPDPQPEQDSFQHQATWLLSEAIPEDPVTNVAGWPRWNILLPHIDAVLGALEPGHTDRTALHLGNLAALYRQHQGQLGPAITLFEQVLADRRRLLGDNHVDTLASRHSVAGAYRSAGRLNEAITLFEQVLADRRGALGDDHPDTLNSRHNIAYTYILAGRVAEAITLFEQVLIDRRRVLGEDHPNTLISRCNLAGAYESAGRLAEAVTSFEQVLTDSRRVLGEDHPDTLISRRDLAGAYRSAGRLAEAITVLDHVLTDSRRLLGDDHPNTQAATRMLHQVRGSSDHGESH